MDIQGTVLALHQNCGQDRPFACRCCRCHSTEPGDTGGGRGEPPTRAGVAVSAG
ncbi:hypothetical protein NSERUTF1_7686 [Nocardia seriolae]|nr:hypothetical protein NSERUTF1_7686 [Nocardia seriolae]